MSQSGVWEGALGDAGVGQVASRGAGRGTQALSSPHLPCSPGKWKGDRQRQAGRGKAGEKTRGGEAASA